MNTGKSLRTTLLLNATLLFIFIFSGCEKQTHSIEDDKSAMLAEAKSFFKVKTVETLGHTGRSARIQGRVPNWERAELFPLSFGDALVVPIKHSGRKIVRTNFSDGASYYLNDITKLLFYRDSLGSPRLEVLTLLPDSNALDRGKYSGTVMVEEWDGTPLKRILIDRNQNIRIWRMSDPTQAKQNKIDSINETTQDNAETGMLSFITVCRTIEGFNYSADDPNGFYWSESLGCDNLYVPTARFMPGDYSGGVVGQIGGGGGSASPGISPANYFSIISAPDPIENLYGYLKCFSNLPGTGYDYQVMLCVSQPEPGTRETWGVNGSGSSSPSPFISVGHTFLVLTQVTPNGTITRNVGYYPRSAVTPQNPVGQGQLSNDANHDFDIAVNIGLTSSQFFQILDFIGNGNSQGYLYNLNSNNCTTFALNALGSAGINLPRTKGTWLNGSGLNPGDLGEDLRNMTLSPNMSRTTTSGTHPNKGECNN